MNHRAKMTLFIGSKPLSYNARTGVYSYIEATHYTPRIAYHIQTRIEYRLGQVWEPGEDKSSNPFHQVPHTSLIVILKCRHQSLANQLACGLRMIGVRMTTTLVLTDCIPYSIHEAISTCSAHMHCRFNHYNH